MTTTSKVEEDGEEEEEEEVEVEVEVDEEATAATTGNRTTVDRRVALARVGEFPRGDCPAPALSVAARIVSWLPDQNQGEKKTLRSQGSFD